MRPYQPIAVADGPYAGRQRENQVGMTNARIGFLNPGKLGTANTAFVYEHVSPISGKQFPWGLGGSNNKDEVRAENGNGKPSVCANPERSLK